MPARMDLISSRSSSPSDGRIELAGSPGSPCSRKQGARKQPPRCQGDGCAADLAATGRRYHLVKRICPAHMTAPYMSRRGRDGLWRFCQQCGMLERLEQFTGDRRSCNLSLAAAKERRTSNAAAAAAAAAASADEPAAEPGPLQLPAELAGGVSAAHGASPPVPAAAWAGAGGGAAAPAGALGSVLMLPGDSAAALLPLPLSGLPTEEPWVLTREEVDALLDELCD